MELNGFLTKITALPGLPGYERKAAEAIAEAFMPLADDVRIDRMWNVHAKLGAEGPRVLVTAHEDEIGLVITKIEDDGCLRFTCSGGVDPRILPAMEVSVQAKDGAIYGVIGAKPPHLSTAEERGKALKMEDMFIDIGLCAESARAKVRPGDQAAMLAPFVEMADGTVAGKTMDDRACVASMLCAAEYLRGMRVMAETVFVAAAQEEVGSIGATTACYAEAPDIAIAIDVTHAEGPGTGKWEAYPIDKLAICTGPNIHPVLFSRIRKTCEENRIPFTVEPFPGVTWTDADPTQVSREGVPTLLIEVPLRYMHTTVETIRAEVVRDVGKLVALFIADITREWEDIKWF